MKNNFLIIGFWIVIGVLCYWSCAKEVLEIDNSDIYVQLEADDYVYNSGDTISFKAIIGNLGVDDAHDIKVSLKRSESALEFISTSYSGHDLGKGVVFVDTLKSNRQIVVEVKAIGTVPSIIPAMHINQYIYVLENKNYDGNSSNNFDQVSISLIP